MTVAMLAPYTAGLSEGLQADLALLPLEVWLIGAHDVRPDLTDEQLTIAWEEFQRVRRRKTTH